MSGLNVLIRLKLELLDVFIHHHRVQSLIDFVLLAE